MNLLVLTLLVAVHPHASKGATSLTDPAAKYRTSDSHHVELRRGPVTAVIVDNADVDVPVLPKHRAGYNGVASLKHEKRSENLFVPGIAGLNFEHIHDGTKAVDRERFEPRKFPMQLRVIDDFTVELHQPPTANWQLESVGRYRLLEDGAIEYSFECIPRADLFRQNCIGLFWASYIDRPEDRSIAFLGIDAARPSEAERWIRHLPERHGVAATHPPAGPAQEFRVDPEFSLTLVNHPSSYRHTRSWYYGVSHGMALVQVFRPRDRIWLAQSPSGGGGENPAWDFQWFIPAPRTGEAYGFVMRALYVPFESPEQIRKLAESHQAQLLKADSRP